MEGFFSGGDLPSELLEWFSVEVDVGDAPELHLIGLVGGDLLRCFNILQSHRPHWTDRTFFIESEGIDVNVRDRPDVAELIEAGAVPVACIGAEGLEVGGVTLPLIEMFLYPAVIEFFWWPSEQWTRASVVEFLSLVTELLAAAPSSEIEPDPRYPVSARRILGDALANYLGQRDRVRVD